MTSPPLLLRLQAESPINRNAPAITRPARPKQLRFFKFFPLTFVIGNLQLAISISSIANYKSQITNSLLVLRRRNPGVFQRPVERASHFIHRHGSIQLLSIDEHRRSCVHSDGVSLVDRGTHRLVILGLEACLQLPNVEIMLLTLQSGQLV